MRSDRAAYFMLAILGIALIINLYAPSYPPGSPYFWSGITQGVMLGVLTSLTALGLFMAAWRRALPPDQTLWQSMNLTQKSLLGFCAIGLLRGALPLLLILFPRAGWVFTGIVILQVAGSAVLVLMIAPVMGVVYRDAFKQVAGQPLRARLELVLQAALNPVLAIGLIVSLVRLFTQANEPSPALVQADRVTLLIILLLVLAISLLHLPERKVKWVIIAAGSALATAYSLFLLLSGG